ncbi:MAG: hypothetical protein ACRYFZ_15925 [Janthinobacterium lividum]
MVRIELHDAKGYDYTKLHAEMKAISFLNTYEGDTAVYQLPTAEYHRKSDQTPAEVLAAVKVAVQKAIKDETAIIKSKNNPPMILVSQFKTFTGLTVIRKKTS